MQSEQAMREAQALRRAGRGREAAGLLDRVLAADPDNPAALELAARLAREHGEHDRALGLWGRLERAVGKSAGLLVEIARTLEAQGQLDAAAAYCGQALEQRPDLGQAHYTLASVLRRQGRMDEAVVSYARVLEHAPGLLAGYVDLAGLLEQINHPEAAQEIAEAGLARWPDEPELNIIAARLERTSGDPDAALRRLAGLDTAGWPPARQARLHYEAGQAADKAGDADRAFEHFRQANRLAREAAPPQVLAAADDLSQIKTLAQQYTPRWTATFTPPIAPEKAQGPDPVFLVGFPRSGTTLLDQILDSHPAITTMEERPFSAELVKLAAASPRGFPLGLADLSDEKVNQGRELYWHLVARQFGPPDGRLVVDKLPLNTIAVGALWRFFPRAKFILALRHPADVCLSCFMQNFALEPLMVSFLSLEQTAELYQLVMRLWLRQAAALPLASHAVRYEDLVADFDATVAGLLEFLGVSWHEAVRGFFRSARAKGRINTPSYHQVSRPIYQEARYRWQRYQKHLAPVLPALRPFIERFGYDQAG